jgi:hypothetical protein
MSEQLGIVDVQTECVSHHESSCESDASLCLVSKQDKIKKSTNKVYKLFQKPEIIKKTKNLFDKTVKECRKNRRAPD